MPYNKVILFSLLTLTLSSCAPVNKKPISPKDGKQETADDLLTLLDPETKTVEQAFVKAKQALAENKEDRALFYFVKVLKMDKQNTQALLGIAAIHNKQKHHEIAEKVYLDILDIDNNNVVANQYIGLKKLKNRQLDQAKQHLLRVIAITPYNWKALNGLGVIADLNKDYSNAIYYYSTALKSNASSPMLLNNLGYSHYLSGNEIEAKKLFNRALDFNETYQRAIFNLALIEIKNQQFDSANILFTRIMEDYESFNNIGYVCMIDNQFDAAESYFKKAISESPYYYPEAQENLKTLQNIRFKVTKAPAVKVMPKKKRTKRLPSPPIPKTKITKTKTAVVTTSISKKTPPPVSQGSLVNIENKAEVLSTSTLKSKPNTEISVEKVTTKGHLEVAIPEAKVAAKIVNTLTNTAVAVKSDSKNTVAPVSSSPEPAIVTKTKALPVAPEKVEPNTQLSVEKTTTNVQLDAVIPDSKIPAETVDSPTNILVTEKSAPLLSTESQPKTEKPITKTSIDAEEDPIQPSIKANSSTVNNDIKPTLEASHDSEYSVSDNKPLIEPIKAPVKTDTQEIIDSTPSTVIPVVAEKEIITPTKTTIIDSIKKPIEPPKTTSTESILKSIQMELERTTKQPLLLDTDISDQTNNILLNDITKKKIVSDPEVLDDEYDD